MGTAVALIWLDLVIHDALESGMWAHGLRRRVPMRGSCGRPVCGEGP